jgi:hypothetical protein
LGSGTVSLERVDVGLQLFPVDTARCLTHQKATGYVVVENQSHRAADRECRRQNCVGFQPQPGLYFSSKLVPEIQEPTASEWQSVRTRVRPFSLPAGIEFVEKVCTRTGYQGLARKCKKNVITIQRPSPAGALQ